MEDDLEIKEYRKGKLFFFKIYRKVKKFGTGAHIIIPKDLIGKRVLVTSIKEKK